MQVFQPNDVKIYCLTTTKNLPEWLPDRKRRQLLQNDLDLQRHVELIQGFDMPCSTAKIAITNDRQYVFAAGVYKPRLKCFETAELSLKFERHLTSEIVTFECLSDDYSKIVALQNDRYISFHAQGGEHYKTRVPKFGRDLAYHAPSCDLYVVGSSPEIYRLNLDQGKFMAPIVTAGTAMNVCKLNPVYGMLGVGTDMGAVECYDPRDRKRVGVLDVVAGLPADIQTGLVPEVTSLLFLGDGLNMAVGTSTGHVLMYDVRSPVPYLVKDHNNEIPIKRLAQHPSSDKIFSVDSHVVKIWDRLSGESFTAFEAPAPINDIALWPESGLFFLALDDPKIQSYFIPTLGPAPKWCGFVDTLVDELDEDNQPALYDNYQFVTREELERMGLGDLIGSSLLRAYMHGFFMDSRLYQKAKAIAEPTSYEEYRQRKVEELLSEETADRLQLQKALRKLPKVNKALAQKIVTTEHIKGLKSATPMTDEEQKTSLMEDSRFSSLFKDPRYQINEESEEYRLINPHNTKALKRMDLVAPQFSLVDEADELGLELEGNVSNDDSSDDEQASSKPPPPRSTQASSSSSLQPKPAVPRRADDVPAAPKLYEMNLGESVDGHAQEHHTGLKKASLGDRLRHLERTEPDAAPRVVRNEQGGIEFSFVPTDKPNKSKNFSDAKTPRREDRRGIKDLNLPKESKVKYWKGKMVKN